MEADETEALRDELARLEAAAPLRVRETARYLEIERRMLALEAEALIKRAREALQMSGGRSLHPRVAAIRSQDTP